MKNPNFLVLSLLFTLLISAACSKDNEDIQSGFSRGIYIVNEGAYTNANASISYYDSDSSILYNNLFARVNGRALGDVAQSFSVAGDLGLIVVNNSQKVEVIELVNFKSVGTITGMDYPRYALEVSQDKLYVTDGNYSGSVYIIDLRSLEITGKITVGRGPENLIRATDLIYVANSGGWDSDSTVSILDPATDKVVMTIEVGDNPTDLAMDKDLNVWVLCKGKVIYDMNWNIIVETGSKLARLNTTTFSVDKSFDIGTIGDYFNPLRLAVGKSGEYLFYAEADGIYKFGINDNTVPSQPLITGSYYGLEVDPASGNLMIFKAKGFDANGTAYIYSPLGQPLDSLTVGIAPNGAAFN